MTIRYSIEQIEAAIPQAIHAQDFTAAVSLVNMLAIRDPSRARTMLNAIHAALDVARAMPR